MDGTLYTRQVGGGIEVMRCHSNTLEKQIRNEMIKALTLCLRHALPNHEMMNETEV